MLLSMLGHTLSALPVYYYIETFHRRCSDYHKSLMLSKSQLCERVVDNGQDVAVRKRGCTALEEHAGRSWTPRVFRKAVGYLRHCSYIAMGTPMRKGV